MDEVEAGTGNPAGKEAHPAAIIAGSGAEGSRGIMAYFSMEIALREEIPTYAGGLGILAGDTLRSSAYLSLPLVGVSLRITPVCTSAA